MVWFLFSSGDEANVISGLCKKSSYEITGRRDLMKAQIDFPIEFSSG